MCLIKVPAGILFSRLPVQSSHWVSLWRLFRSSSADLSKRTPVDGGRARYILVDCSALRAILTTEGILFGRLLLVLRLQVGGGEDLRFCGCWLSSGGEAFRLWMLIARRGYVESVYFLMGNFQLCRVLT